MVRIFGRQATAVATVAAVYWRLKTIQCSAAIERMRVIIDMLIRQSVNESNL